ERPLAKRRLGRLPVHLEPLRQTFRGRPTLQRPGAVRGKPCVAEPDPAPRRKLGVVAASVGGEDERGVMLAPGASGRTPARAPVDALGIAFRLVERRSDVAPFALGLYETYEVFADE